MDGLKLDKWKETFNKAVALLQVEFDEVLKNKKLQKLYTVEVDDMNDNLSLFFTNEAPQEIKESLEKLLIKTKPEDSI